MGIPRPQEKRRAVLVASEHQNSMWWNLLTENLSDMGFFRMKFLKPTSLKAEPVWSPATAGAEFPLVRLASVPILDLDLDFDWILVCELGVDREAIRMRCGVLNLNWFETGYEPHGTLTIGLV